MKIFKQKKKKKMLFKKQKETYGSGKVTEAKVPDNIVHFSRFKKKKKISIYKAEPSDHYFQIHIGTFRVVLFRSSVVQPI